MVRRLRFLDLIMVVISLAIMILFCFCNMTQAADSNVVVWAATGGGVSKTEDGGKTWVNYFLGTGKHVHSIAVKDSIVWAGTELGVCKSLDGGKTWTTYDSKDGLPAYHLPALKNHIFVSSICIASDSTVWIACKYLPRSTNTIGKTHDGGKTWKFYELAKGKIGYEVNSIISIDGSIWAAAPGTRSYSTRTDPGYKFGGLYRTDNDGRTWTAFTTWNGLFGNQVNSVFAHDKNVYVMTDKGIDLTEDHGKTWQRFAPAKFRAFDVLRYPTSLFTSNGQEVFVAYGTMLSTTQDSGKTWDDIDIADRVKEQGIMTSINSMLIIGDEIWLGIALRGPNDKALGGVLRSVDGGKNWKVYTIDDGLGGYVYALTVEK